MPAEITMPQLTDTMTEGALVRWRKAEGEKVKQGEIIAEVETDKAVMEMEAFESGTLAVLAAKEGDKVKVGDVMGVIAQAGEDAAEVKRRFAASARHAAPSAGAAKSASVPPVSPPAVASARRAAPASEGTGGTPAPTAATAGAAPILPATPAAANAPSQAAPRPTHVPPPPPAPTRVPVVQRPASSSAVASLPGAAAPGAAPSVKAAPKAPAPRADFDIIVIGGGPAGYAAAIRAGQLKKRVLCIEKENLGGTCLNWGCIPTKALLEDGSFIRKLRTDAAAHGVTVSDLQVDFPKIIARSRAIASRLANGIAHLFRKYEVKHEMGSGQLLAPYRVKLTTAQGGREITAEHIIIAVGAKPTALPGVEFDRQRIITSREAMTLPTLPKRMAIIGAGAIGCEFADFYNALGTEVVIVEMLDHLLPIEDHDVSLLLEKLFSKRGIDVRVKTKTDKVEKTDSGVRLTLSGQVAGTVDADVVLVAVGVTGNVQNLAAPDAGLELFKNRVKVNPEYQTNLENVWAVGDCISMHWPEHMAMGGYRHPDLAHVAHHEAVNLVEHIAGVGDHAIDYRFIPGCTYTHPQVASMGLTERAAREQNRAVRIGKFPFNASGRALAAGDPDGFVKLIFDAKHGELLGVHMVGAAVTELLSELVLARNLEATDAELIAAMHPHPTYSEAVMEAAGVAAGHAIHL